MRAWESDAREWLEADGLGGFACGTASGIRTRRYHGVLLIASRPPVGRLMLVNGFDAWIDIDNQHIALSSQRYAPDVVHPDGIARLTAFSCDPWPRWVFAVNDFTIVQELMVSPDVPGATVSWRLEGDSSSAQLVVRPFLSGRDYHSLHRENPAFNFDATVEGDSVRWTPYASVPGIQCRSNGTYRHQPLWYRQFRYVAEEQRGLDAVEDLASPGEVHWRLTRGQPAVWHLSTATASNAADGAREPIESTVERIRQHESERRARFASRLERSADAYIVRRGRGRTVVAGYPWFTDWGRDTFIALRGLATATQRFQDAADILVEWSESLSEGMLPNRFPDAGDVPEFNSVDASLWFVVAVFELQRAAAAARHYLAPATCAQLDGAVDRIVQGYAEGTRFRIAADGDGLLAAGENDVPLTWMDARVSGRSVTPRIGKPVEVNALWLNALWIAGRRSARWNAAYRHARASFAARFWNHDERCLYDVVDVNHQPGAVDRSVRPNQVFAIGGLPLTVVPLAMGKQIVECVEQRLLTPLGLRTLAPGSPGYAGQYRGGPDERDGAYHQGTVWPWLMGAFVEAWVRVRGSGAQSRAVARARFVAPLIAQLEITGLGHLTEIADAEPPFAAHGCPFQAWSLGELIRLERHVLNQPRGRQKA